MAKLRLALHGLFTFVKWREEDGSARWEALALRPPPDMPTHTNVSAIDQPPPKRKKGPPGSRWTDALDFKIPELCVMITVAIDGTELSGQVTLPTAGATEPWWRDFNRSIPCLTDIYPGAIDGRLRNVTTNESYRYVQYRVSIAGGSLFGAAPTTVAGYAIYTCSNKTFPITDTVIFEADRDDISEVTISCKNKRNQNVRTQSHHVQELPNDMSDFQLCLEHMPELKCVDNSDRHEDDEPTARGELRHFAIHRQALDDSRKGQNVPPPRVLTYYGIEWPNLRDHCDPKMMTPTDPLCPPSRVEE